MPTLSTLVHRVESYQCVAHIISHLIQVLLLTTCLRASTMKINFYYGVERFSIYRSSSQPFPQFPALLIQACTSSSFLEKHSSYPLLKQGFSIHVPYEPHGMGRCQTTRVAILRISIATASSTL